MKTIILLASVFLSLHFAPRMRGDSIFALSNLDRNVNAPVFDAAGIPLEGPNYLAELWGGITPESLVPAINYTLAHDRVFAPFGGQGYFFAGAGAQVPSTENYYAWLQVRAWDARLGSTYEEVAALDEGGYGESLLFYAQGKRYGDMLGLPAPLDGLQSFYLRQVPEPSTSALLILGGVVLCWATRRKRETHRASTDVRLMESHKPWPVLPTRATGTQRAEEETVA